MEFLYDPVIMALWAGLATGALISEAVAIILERRALRLSGMTPAQIREHTEDE